MSQLSPSMNDIPPATLTSTVPRDPLLSCLDTNPMPSPDHGSSFSPYKTFSSVTPMQKTLGVESPTVPGSTYIKLQDAVKSFKANTCRSAGLPPKNVFLHDNRDSKNTPKQTTTHTVRSQSPVTPVLTSRGTVQTENRSQSRNQVRTSVTNTSLRESPSRAGNLNSSRTGLNGSRETSANRQSPPKTTNLSIDKGKYSEIHKRDMGIAHAKNTDIGKYRPQTSRPAHQPEEPVFTSANNRERREADGVKFNVLREILHPENEIVQSYEKEKNIVKKGALFQRDLVSEVQGKLETATRCSKHDQPYLLLNTVNKQLYCVECAFHGPQANQTKQSLVSLKAASHVITDLSKRMYNEADKKINILEQNINVCKKNRDIAQQEYDNHIALIDREFSELMDALRKRKLVLKKDLDTVMEDTFNEIDHKLDNLEFLKQGILETKEIYSPHNFEANVEFYATYNILKDTLSSYDYQAFLLSRDHFNVLEIKGKSKIKVEIEAMGKVLPSNYTSKSLQRPKSMPRCSRTSVANCAQKEVTEHNYQTQQRSGTKSAEKYDKTSSIANSPERKKNSISPTRADTITHTQVSTVRNSTKQTKVDFREDFKGPKPFMLKVDEDIIVNKKEITSTRGSSKQILATWSSNSNRGSVNPGTPNKENRQKFAKAVDVDYYGPVSTGKKRNNGSSGHQAPRKIHIPEYAPLEKSKGLFEEIEALKFLQIGKTEDDESSSKDVYKEVESVLASIKNKEMFSPKKISFINAEFFKESSILTNQYHAQELYNMLPIGMKSTRLHYKLSRDGPGSEVFHEKCDNQGPCVVLVKVDGSCVFGYYSPVSFVKSDRYDLCEDAFIFSLQNPLYTKPHKFPIKEQKKLFGIFQSTVSPCLGSTLPNKQDLFIQFDDLSSSCSMIGYAYALPSGIEGSKALAGKYTGWKFDDIEVFGLEF